MQLIRAFGIDPEGYVKEDVHLKVSPPCECPHCLSAGTLWSLGYYQRSISRLTAGLLRLWIRRFRCRGCRKTVSILPSFAQPYRFVQNSTKEICRDRPQLEMPMGGGRHCSFSTVD
jgi:hypothetical protein